MKKFLSAFTAFMLAFSAFAATAYANYDVAMQTKSIYAKPPIEVTLPRNMTFVFNPFDITINGKGSVDKSYGNYSKIICNYVDSNVDAWVIRNDSDVAIKAGVYAYSDTYVGSDFSVRDKNINTVDASDKEFKYLFLDIKVSGGSSGTKSVTLLDTFLKTDEGEDSRRLNIKKSLWDEDNSELLTVIRDVPKDGEIQLTMTGTTQNAGELIWTRRDKATVYFVFTFDVEPV